MFAEVIMDISNAEVDRRFTYKIPDGLEVMPGHRVLVPFGVSSKPKEGFVLSLTDTTELDEIKIKSIIRTLEPYTVLLEEQLNLANWIKEVYRCVFVDALRLMIPAQLRGGRVSEKIKRTVKISENIDIDITRQSFYTKKGEVRSAKQLELFELLVTANKFMKVEDINAFVPNAASAINVLLKKGIIVEQGVSVYRDPFSMMQIKKTEPLVLTSKQAEVMQTIEYMLGSDGGTALLHGVTGSGKTEVYMQAIARAIENGQGAIVLVPEISLTPQTMDRFKGRFGDRVAVLHSRLSSGERYDQWRRIRLGKADVVVGARSAIFAPVNNLKLIIIDEEHETSYRSDTVPRYSAVEVARHRVKTVSGTLILGSATPSIASYKRAASGKDVLLELPDRINKMPLPNVKIIDMRQEFASGNTSIFSAHMYKALESCLAAGEQAILFLNRRGYSTFVSCRGCGHVLKCPSCDVSLTYHKVDGVVKCHYCGYSKKLTNLCPECNKPYLKYFGLGTQQVEEQFNVLFPNFTAVRMDMDTTSTKNAHYELLQKFVCGEAQVLIGTQMIAKGLDIPNVTLVGIIAADSMLFIPDFRSEERTFQLLTQVAGRAGRAGKSGEVIVQTYCPEHEIIELSANHDYKSFYQKEIVSRRAALFPPYSLFVRIIFLHESEETLVELSSKYEQGADEAMRIALKGVGGSEHELLMCTSGPAPIKRKNNKFRYHLLIRLARTRNTPEALDALYAFHEAHKTQNISQIMINPTDMF